MNETPEQRSKQHEPLLRRRELLVFQLWPRTMPHCLFVQAWSHSPPLRGSPCPGMLEIKVSLDEAGTHYAPKGSSSLIPVAP